MSRVRSLLLAAVVVASVLAVASPASGHQTAFAVDATLDPAQPTAGEDVTVTITVDSLLDEGEAARVSSVELRNGTADDADVVNRTRPNEWVGAGGEKQWDLGTTFEETGEREVGVSVVLVTQDGEHTSVMRPLTVTVRDTHPSLAIATDPVGPAGRTDVTLTLANGAGANVTGLDVALSSPDVSFSEPRRVISALAPGRETDLAFTAAEVEAGETTFTAEISYSTAAGERRSYGRTLSTRIDAVENPGRIELTGTRIEQQGRTIVVRGSASNPGSTNATGAIVRASDGDRIAPASSQSSFFVGDVRAGEFSSFEVHARLTESTNETVEIPIELEYGVDGERLTRETTLAFTPSADAEQPRRTGGGTPLGLIGLALVGVLAYAGYRRFR